jgi:hypothetical protein
MTSPNFTKICAHCGLVCGDTEGGYGAVTDEAGAIRASCSPSVPGRPDCYARITKYGEPLGELLGIEPKPSGVEDIRNPGPLPTTYGTW